MSQLSPYRLNKGRKVDDSHEITAVYCHEDCDQWNLRLESALIRDYKLHNSRNSFAEILLTSMRDAGIFFKK